MTSPIQLATRSCGCNLHGHQELVAMELAVVMSIELLLFHLHCASEFEAPFYAVVSPSESLLGVPNDELRTRLWLVGHLVIISCQITVAVGVDIRNWATIRQTGKPVPLVVERAQFTHFLLNCVQLTKNSQVCGHASLIRNY